MFKSQIYKREWQNSRFASRDSNYTLSFEFWIYLGFRVWDLEFNEVWKVQTCKLFYPRLATLKCLYREDGSSHDACVISKLGSNHLKGLGSRW